jgi:hypothetical protein
MPRNNRDREDLLAEATALVERVSLRIDELDRAIVAGFRRDGGVSVYWGASPVYQFTAAGALRRAFVDPLLYKAERGRLVSMRRERTDEAVEMVRHDLSEVEQVGFLTAMRARLNLLAARLTDGGFTVIGRVPDGADVVARLRSWLDGRSAETLIADSPRAG